MDSLFPPSYTRHHLHRLVAPNSSAAYSPWFICFASSPGQPTQSTKNPITSAIVRLRFPFSVSQSTLTSMPCRRHSTPPGSPPPKLDEQTPSSVERAMSTFSKAHDAARIFLAVLFWMSLFFWSSASDISDNGRPNKDSRFRK